MIIIQLQICWKCKSLTNITFRSSVQIIERESFQNCPLAEITLPLSLTQIGVGAFENCSLLKSGSHVFITAHHWKKYQFLHLLMHFYKSHMDKLKIKNYLVLPFFQIKIVKGEINDFILSCCIYHIISILICISSIFCFEVFRILVFI